MDETCHGPHAGAEYHHHHTHAEDSRHPGAHHLLTVENLTVAYEMYDPRAPFWRPRRVLHEVLHDLTLSVHEGEILAIVGASGSGKSVLADALMGLFDLNAVACGDMWFDGRRVGPRDFDGLRGHGVALVPQDVTYLDPLMRVGEQVRGEARGEDRTRRKADAERRLRRQRELFEAYGLSAEVEKRYPHELSGGMARRVLLMCALMEEPRLLIADEPTPGMDDESAAVAASDLRAFADGGGGVLLITHDLGFALHVADRLAVFREGTVVEETSVAAFADGNALRDPYARELSRAWDRLRAGEIGAPGAPWSALEANRRGCANALLRAEGLAFARAGGEAVFEGVNLVLSAGDRLALRGASGAGKSTLCRVLAGQLDPSAGAILMGDVPAGARRGSPDGADGGVLSAGEARGNGGRPYPVQLVPQHPETAFDPAMSLGESLAEAGEVQGGRTVELMHLLAVDEDWLARRPHEVSGGQLVRVALVRALMASPRVLICDESTASLDACSQEQVWRALLACQEVAGFGLMFVSHDSALVRSVATGEVRLEGGRLVRKSSTY